MSLSFFYLNNEQGSSIYRASTYLSTMYLFLSGQETGSELSRSVISVDFLALMS